MPSIFAYYRPRGVKGNYIVAILLDLLESEIATISVARQRDANCGHCGVQRPYVEQHAVSPARKMDEGQERRWELFKINHLISGDKITIQIKDKDVIPYQETIYWARMDCFFAAPQCFLMNHTNYGVIDLNSIRLIDCDQEKVLQQTLYNTPAAEQQPEAVRIAQLLFTKPDVTKGEEVGNPSTAISHQRSYKTTAEELTATYNRAKQSNL